MFFAVVAKTTEDIPCVQCTLFWDVWLVDEPREKKKHNTKESIESSVWALARTYIDVNIISVVGIFILGFVLFSL